MGLIILNPIATGQQNAGLPSFITVEDGGTGLFKAIVTGDISLKGFTVYRPQDLSAFGKKQKLPVILWGNGGCMNNSLPYKNFLNEIASNEYIVIAIGPYEAVVNLNQDMMRQSTKSAQLLEALNWQLKGDENSSKMLTGENCGLCKDLLWKIETKNMNY